MKKNFDPIIFVEEDGLAIPEVGIWAIEKYQLLGGYCDIFTKGMRTKWKNLVYLDLYSAAGYSRIRENGKVVKSSPLIALSVPTKFDKYIFCEEDHELFSALLKRVEKNMQQTSIELFNVNCNSAIDQIKNSIPKYSTNNTVLSFCFLDPYDLSISFSTIKNLTSGLVDFLILQALHMDGNRNFRNYISENNEKISNYLGRNDWRKLWENSELLPKDFVKFLADQYDENMKELGYLTAKRHLIKHPSKNLPLYYLTFYSKHKTGLDFFEKVDDYSTPQLNFEL